MRALNAPTEPVLLYEHATESGHVLAEVQLHAEATFNALSLDMIDLIAPELTAWAGRSEVVGVLFSGAGDRAFCAGADLRSLYHAMVSNHQQGRVVDEYPYRFFEHEYRFDYQLHNYPKPVITVGHGVVMGGGLGIFSASRYRVITDCARVAMPEVTIGLFPDAGLSWLLRNIPRHFAIFLGVTGSHMNGADALVAGIASHAVAGAARDQVRDALLAASWHEVPERAIGDALARVPGGDFPEPQLQRVPDSLGHVTDARSAVNAIEGLTGLGAWIDGGIASMQSGCPTTVGIVIEQLKRVASMGLAETLRMELTIATHCASNHDFAEGIRALMIDKDASPRWQFGELDAPPQAYVQSHFAQPWPRNPLADL